MLKIERRERHIRPHLNKSVRVTKSGDVLEIMYARKRSKNAYIRKLDKDNYVLLSTGEVFSFNHSDNRSKNLNTLSRTFSRARNIINANVSSKNISNCLWVTLTYKVNMTDTKKATNDFKNFRKRLKEKYGHFEYISAMEAQGRGAWHFHLILIFNRKAPFISCDSMKSCWKQGNVSVKSLECIDNVGAYLTAYLTNLTVDEAVDCGTILVLICFYFDEAYNFLVLQSVAFYLEKIKLWILLCRWSR